MLFQLSTYQVSIAKQIAPNLWSAVQSVINSDIISADRVTCRFISDDLVAWVSGKVHPWDRSTLSYSFPAHPAS